MRKKGLKALNELYDFLRSDYEGCEVMRNILENEIIIRKELKALDIIKKNFNSKDILSDLILVYGITEEEYQLVKEVLE